MRRVKEKKTFKKTFSCIGIHVIKSLYETHLYIYFHASKTWLAVFRTRLKSYQCLLMVIWIVLSFDVKVKVRLRILLFKGIVYVGFSIFFAEHSYLIYLIQTYTTVFFWKLQNSISNKIPAINLTGLCYKTRVKIISILIDRYITSKKSIQKWDKKIQ